MDTAELTDDTLFVGDAQRADELIQQLNFRKYKPSTPDCSFTVLDTEGKLEPRCKDVAHLPSAMISLGDEMLVERKRKQVQDFMVKGVVVPEEILSTNSVMLLHIGDTHSVAYPFYEDLIRKVKPDIIIYTGDFVDVVKVGRMINTEEQYETELRKIADVLKNSVAKKIYVTSGNKDLPFQCLLGTQSLPAAGYESVFIPRALKNTHAVKNDGLLFISGLVLPVATGNAHPRCI